MPKPPTKDTVRPSIVAMSEHAKASLFVGCGVSHGAIVRSPVDPDTHVPTGLSCWISTRSSSTRAPSSVVTRSFERYKSMVCGVVGTHSWQPRNTGLTRGPISFASSH